MRSTANYYYSRLQIFLCVHYLPSNSFWQDLMAHTNDQHVMLSYNWGSKVVVSQIYKILVDSGIRTWMDVNGGMGDYIYERYVYQNESFSPYNHVTLLQAWLMV